MPNQSSVRIEATQAADQSLQQSLVSAEMLSSATMTPLPRRQPQVTLLQRLQRLFRTRKTPKHDEYAPVDHSHISDAFLKEDFSRMEQVCEPTPGRQARSLSFEMTSDDYFQSSSQLSAQELFDNEALTQKWDSSYSRVALARSEQDSCPQGQSPHVLTGILFMCGAAFVNVVSSCLTQTILSAPVSSGLVPSIPDVLFFRSFPTLLFQFLLSRFLAKPLFSLKGVRSGDRAILFARILVPNLTFVFACYALQQVEVSIYTVIFQTNPFLTSIGAYFFLKAAISKTDFTATVACFIAVICIVISKSSSPAASVQGVGVETTEKIGCSAIGLVLAFCASLSNSVANVTTKRLEYVHWNFVLFHVSLLGCLFWTVYSSCHYLATGTASISSLSLEQVTQLSLLGVSEVFFMTCGTLAYQNGKPSTVALFSYTNLMWAFFADVLIFNRPVSLGQLLPTLFIATLTISLGVAKACERTTEKGEESGKTLAGNGN